MEWIVILNLRLISEQILSVISSRSPTVQPYYKPDLSQWTVIRIFTILFSDH